MCDGPALCITATVFTIVISIFLFAFSWSTFQPTQYAIIYNANTLHLDSTEIFLHGGRDLTGLGTKFIRFNALYRRSHAKDVSVRSKDGLPFYISYSYTYQVHDTIEDIYRFYLDFGKDENADQIDIFDSMAGAAVRDVASRFLAFDYFADREVMNQMMHDVLAERLTRVYVDVTTFQITGMTVPQKFADVIEDTQVAIQQVSIAMSEFEKVKVRADGMVLVANKLAQVQVLLANATSQALTYGVTFDGQALRHRLETQTDAMAKTMTDWGLQPSELLDYMHLNVLKETGAEVLKMGVKYPTAFALN